MTLKEQIAADRDTVFFNLDDFAEEHKVDGKVIKIILDTDSESAKAQAVGVDGQLIKIFAKTEELPKRRSPGQTLNLDGKELVIIDWAENLGVSEITLDHTITM